jgi:hypothetical protein
MTGWQPVIWRGASAGTDEEMNHMASDKTARGDCGSYHPGHDVHLISALHGDRGGPRTIRGSMMTARSRSRTAQRAGTTIRLAFGSSWTVAATRCVSDPPGC